MGLIETHVAPGVWMGTLGGDTAATSYGANAVAIAGADGTLLVDPLISAAQARLVTDFWSNEGRVWDWTNRIVYLPKSP